jgi:hypothetical protein
VSTFLVGPLGFGGVEEAEAGSQGGQEAYCPRIAKGVAVEELPRLEISRGEQPES